MTLNIGLLGILCLSALPSATLSNAHDNTETKDGYKMVWHDEFDGDSLDTRAWNIEVGGNGNGNAELEYYTDNASNISLGMEPVSGEHCLIITARREEYNGKSFTSGRINTCDKVHFTRGKIESRIKFPKTANGLWPAFWLLGNDYKENGWPRCGEIDILEMGHTDGIKLGLQDRYFNGACHWGFYKDSNYPNYAKATANRYPLQDDEFHTFTLEWDKSFICMYLDKEQYPDAEPYYKIGVSETSDEWSTGNYFHHDFFVLFNLAVGGWFTGILAPDGITALKEGEEPRMYVDWVRLYQKTNEVNATIPL